MQETARIDVNVKSKPGLELMEELTPVLFGAASFQQLNAGCEIGLFELLNKRPNQKKQEIGMALELQPRALDILLLGTTALGLTAERNGLYRNSAVIGSLFKEGKWAMFKDVVAFEQHVVYEGQADYVDALRANTNVGLRRIRGRGRDLYHRLSENPRLEEVFYRYMRSWSEYSNPLLLKHADFTGVRRLLDVGGGDGVNTIAIAKAHPEMKLTVMEISETATLTRRRILDAGLSERVSVSGGDMFADPYPAGHDAILFAHQLVIWTPEENLALLKRAYEALGPGGKVFIFSSISNDEGDGPVMAALDSVYFAAIPAEGGMIYSWRQYESWLREAGFATVKSIPCGGWTPHGLMVGTK